MVRECQRDSNLRRLVTRKRANSKTTAAMLLLTKAGIVMMRRRCERRSVAGGEIDEDVEKAFSCDSVGR